MDRDDVIRMAREAGYDLEAGQRIGEVSDWEIFERFARLIAAHERELCAQVCEAHGQANWDQEGGAMNCAAAIRQRGSAD